MTAYSWIIYSQNKLVGTISVKIDKSHKNPHEIKLLIHPDHQVNLAKSMVYTALSKIQDSGFVDQNTLITVRSTNNELMEILKNLDFKIVEINHRLGLKFKPTYF